MKIDYKNKVYENTGNHALLNLTPNSLDPSRILDVGVGNGSNAAHLRFRYPSAVIEGITISSEEAKIASDILDKVWVFDINGDIHDLLGKRKYDLIIISHVFEHLAEPGPVLCNFLRILNKGGICLIAVPNILVLNRRIDFLWGNWNYTETGTMDKTHLRFFTYNNIEEVLELSKLRYDITVKKIADSRLPLVYFLKRLHMQTMVNWLNLKIGGLFPNLFSWQVMLLIKKNSDGDINK